MADRLSARFGAHWPAVLVDLRRAGRPAQLALAADIVDPALAALADGMSATYGTATAELRGKIDPDAARAIDDRLAGLFARLATDPNGPDLGRGSAFHEIASRRAYDLVRGGEAPAEAARTAAREVARLTAGTRSRVAAATAEAVFFAVGWTSMRPPARLVQVILLVAAPAAFFLIFGELVSAML